MSLASFGIWDEPEALNDGNLLQLRHIPHWRIAWAGGILRSRTVAAASVLTVMCDLDAGKVGEDERAP